MTFSAPNLASRMTAEDASDLCRCIQVAFQADSVRHACAKPARVLNICGRGALSVFAARTMTGLARFFIPPTFLVCLEQAVRIAFDEIAVDFFMAAHANGRTHVLGWFVGFTGRGSGRSCLCCWLGRSWLLASRARM